MTTTKTTTPKKRGRPRRDASAHTRRRTLEDEFQQGKLNVEGMEKGYYYHVVNDKDGRVERLKRRGYEVVQHNGVVSMGDANAKEVGTVVQTTASRTGDKAVLMRIPQEFKDEDDAFRQSLVDKSEEAMFRQEENEQGRYGEIKREVEKIPR